jgi:predicted TIM-barrel fold metal-dependent hydrolase
MTAASEIPLPYPGEIIDAHTHVDEVPALGWIDPPEKLIALLDETGIGRAIVMTYTELPGFNPHALDYLAEVVGRFPDRLIGFVRLHPWYAEAANLLEEALGGHRMKGIKLHPVGTLDHPGSDATLRLLRLAGAHNAPALFHCGDEPLSTPLAVEQAAQRAPETTIILGHMGGYFHVADALRVAERRPNIVLETSAMPYPAKIKEAVSRVGADRVIYGSDGPGCPPRLEVRKVLAAGLEPADLAKVMHGTIARILDGVVH